FNPKTRTNNKKGISGHFDQKSTCPSLLWVEWHGKLDVSCESASDSERVDPVLACCDPLQYGMHFSGVLVLRDQWKERTKNAVAILELRSFRTRHPIFDGIVNPERTEPDSVELCKCGKRKASKIGAIVGLRDKEHVV